jgi:hypothetical protein
LLFQQESAKAKRAARGGGVYIGLSQGFSRWAKMHNPDKVPGEGGAGQCPAGTFCENWGLSRVGPDNV